MTIAAHAGFLSLGRPISDRVGPSRRSPSDRGHWLAVLLCVLGVALAASRTSRAQPRPDLVPLTENRVQVGPGVPDRAAYEALSSRIADLERTSDQTYYLVVLRSTGRGAYATRDYVDALYEAWVDQANRTEATFDPERSVLVVMGLENRQISVHAGPQLQEEYGLTATTLDREIVQPQFINLARQGRYAEGLDRLLTTIDDWIARRDEQQASRRREAERRAIQARADAEASLATAARTLDEARRELTQVQKTGLNAADLSTRLEHAGAALADLQGRGSDDAQATLRDAQQVQRTIQETLSSLRQRVAQQAEATARLDALLGMVRDVDQAIVAALQAGLPVGSARDELDAAQDRIDSARHALASDPASALALAGEAENRLKEIRTRVASLPELKSRLNALAGKVRPLETEVTAALERAERDGADIATIRDQFEATRKSLAAALGPDVEDLGHAVATVQAGEAQLRDDLQRIQQAEDRRRFLSRTLPIGLAVAVGLLALLVVGLVRLLHLRTFRSVGSQFQEFRNRAVEVMDRLDALKERYKTLPTTDPDFRAPMTGATLALYVRVQEELDQLWGRWLKIMETVDEAQRLIGNRSLLGVRRLQEAGELLKQGAIFDEVQTQEQACAADLDRLNRAHEEATSLRAVLDARMKAVSKRLESLTGEGLSTEAFKPEQAAVATLTEQGATLLTPDPLGAQDAFREALERAEALRTRADAVQARAREAHQALDAIQEVQNQAAGYRSSGLKLQGEDSNPDAPLNQARAAHAQGLDALQAGNPEAAAQHIQHAAALTDQARQVITQTLEARETSRRELTARKREAQRLAAALDRAGSDLTELQRDFAPATWQAVSDHAERARDLLGSVEPQIQQAAGAASDSTQQYLLAARILADVARQQGEALGLLEAVGARLRALRAARDESRAAVQTLTELEAQTTRQFESNDAVIGEAARTALAAARDRLRAVGQAAAAPQPDWDEIRATLAQAAADFTTAREQAEADRRAHDSLTERLRQARDRADQVGDLLRREDKDRAPVNHRFRRAVAALDRITSQARDSRGDWPRLLQETEDALTDLDLTERLAHQDIQLGNRAIAEIAGANRQLREVRTFSSLGVTADLDDAREALRRAQDALQERDYEQAIALADAAEAAARRAYNDAVAESRRRQQRMEAERRRREAATIGRPSGGPNVSLPDLVGMAAVVLGDALTEASRSRPGRPAPPSRRGGRSSRSSSTSWSKPPRRDSGSSQSQW